jgi:hypothetical protein
MGGQDIYPRLSSNLETLNRNHLYICICMNIYTRINVYTYLNMYVHIYVYTSKKVY